MKTHLQIQQRAFSKLLKAKVAEFANSIRAIIRNQAPESLLIASLTSYPEALNPTTELLYSRFKIDPQQSKTETLKSKLMLTASTLKLSMCLLSKRLVDDG